MPVKGHRDKYRRFCEVLVTARVSTGLTQQDVAKRLTKPQSFVSKYESGERRLDVVEFLLVARALGLEPLKLLKKVEEA